MITVKNACSCTALRHGQMTTFIPHAVHMRLAEAGIAVYGYDHHGHGESDPKDIHERALVHDWHHLVC